MSVHFVFLLITFFGVCGGIAYSLSIDSSYTLQLPWMEKEFETGVLGHGFVGALAAFVSFPIAEYLLKMNLTVVGANQTRLQIIAYIAAVSVIGGFSGLRLISGMSQALMRRVHETEHAVKELQRTTEVNSFETHLTRANERIRINQYEAALADITDALRIKESPRALLVKARALRWMNRYSDAISTLDKAIQIGFENKVDAAVAYWNRACYKKLAGSEVASILEDIDKSITIQPSYKQDVLAETDFGDLLTDDDFRARYAP